MKDGPNACSLFREGVPLEVQACGSDEPGLAFLGLVPFLVLHQDEHLGEDLDGHPVCRLDYFPAVCLEQVLSPVQACPDCLA